MSRFVCLAAVSIALALLSGCATMSEHECLTADWESVGYIDGTRGHDGGRLGDHSEACAKHGIRPDRQLYDEGRGRGLEQFCTGSNGVRVGREGYSYNGACPATLEPDFLNGYDLGRNMRDIEVRMQELQTEVERVQTALRREEPPLKDSERDSLIYRLRYLEREFGQWQMELRMLETRARDF